MKTKIFIDFWNLQLTWNEFHKKQGATGFVKIPWGNTLTNILLRNIGADPNSYAGTHVYASVNPKSHKDRGLRSFLQGIEMHQGYKVQIKERKLAKPIRCPHDGCREEITHCPKCNGELIRTTEKGVDTTIAIELYRFALDGAYDKAILISHDEDLVPAIEDIQDRRDNKIIHAGFKSQGYTIRRACWTHIFFDDIMQDLLHPSP